MNTFNLLSYRRTLYGKDFQKIRVAVIQMLLTFTSKNISKRQRDRKKVKVESVIKIIKKAFPICNSREIKMRIELSHELTVAIYFYLLIYYLFLGLLESLILITLIPKEPIRININVIHIFHVYWCFDQYLQIHDLHGMQNAGIIFADFRNLIPMRNC